MKTIKCVKCDKENTTLIKDALMMGKITDIFECADCKGVIEVQYTTKNKVMKNVKSYRYVR